MERIKKIASKSYVCWLLAVVVAGLLWQMGGMAHALPALQLGDGGIGDWVYDTSTQTWVTSSDSFKLDAYANADGRRNGDYAWDGDGAATQHAYLVVSAMPQTTDDGTDSFDVSIANDGGALSLLTSGYGTPPINDPNSIPGHGIFDTYFEIYEFQFDGEKGTISDTQPGQTGTGQGYTETFDIDINSLVDGITGVHFDLLTVSGDGIYDPSSPDDNKLVNAVAPFSHDAEAVPGPGPVPGPIPEPSTVFLLGIGLLGVLGLGRKFKK
ncbi:MAG: PEP-CTERM sorting domain-containing protein [bacterium]|nr:PEP-CTERM sorting domain-containing protein [bacterium]